MWYLLGQTVTFSSTVPVGFEFELSVRCSRHRRAHLRWIAAVPVR
jgi:hypothetical protein